MMAKLLFAMIPNLFYDILGNVFPWYLPDMSDAEVFQFH